MTITGFLPAYVRLRTGLKDPYRSEGHKQDTVLQKTGRNRTFKILIFFEGHIWGLFFKIHL